MDKHTWHSVKTLSSNSLKPSSRWGHSCCVVGEQIVFFGGYADSNYMNDLWAFNSNTMKWRDIQTFGDIPKQRSNCTMNYDKQNNQIVIFGGGGANKQRFNSISVLDWSTKNWVEISPKQNEVAPWERTYHAAEFLHPYLIIFGGEGVADMEDIWVFNFKTLSWNEIKIPADKLKPCARRFHSSVLIGNEFMVIAGCYGKYRCLSDIFSIDLTSLLRTGSTQGLEWVEKKMKNSSFLTRWGHSSVVYDNKIYIFGGRFSNDLNDLLAADFETNSIRTIKTNPEAPPARRRHCAGFIGSSMLVFGGFNGQYFQDLHYINVHEAKSKLDINMQQDLVLCVNNKQLADGFVMDCEEKRFYINFGLIAKYFESQEKMQMFLESITGKYTNEELYAMFKTVYQGYGQLKIDEKEFMCESIPENRSEMIAQEKQKIERFNEQELKQSQQKIFKKAMNSQSIIIKLKQQQFIEYFLQRQQKGYNDQSIRIGPNIYQLNRITLILKSQYFYNLFITSAKSNKLLNPSAYNQIQITDLTNDKIVYQIFFNYLQTGFLVLPDNVSAETFMHLYIVSDYFMVSSLDQVCSNQLISMINSENVETLLKFAMEMKIAPLMRSACDYWIKKAFESINKLNQMDLEVYVGNTFTGYSSAPGHIMKMYSKLRFDLYQTYMEDEKKMMQGKKKDTSNSNVEKENSENNIIEPAVY